MANCALMQRALQHLPLRIAITDSPTRFSSGLRHDNTYNVDVHNSSDSFAPPFSALRFARTTSVSEGRRVARCVRSATL